MSDYALIRSFIVVKISANGQTWLAATLVLEYEADTVEIGLPSRTLEPLHKFRLLMNPEMMNGADLRMITVNV